MNSLKNIYAFVGGWLLGRPKGKLGPISADTSPGGFVLSGKPGGISTLEMDPEGKKLEKVSYTGEGIPVGFMVVSPDWKYLYAAWEGNTYDGRVASGSCVYAYRINRANGSLTLLNSRSSIGSCTNYLALDSQGKYLFVSNHGEYGAISKIVQNDQGKWEVQPKYDDASLAVFPIAEDGSLGEATDVKVFNGDELRPGGKWHAKGIGAHMHCINIDPTDQLVIACDIEFARLLLYHFDRENGKLVPCENAFYQFQPPVQGARHVLFHPALPYLYVIADGLEAFDYDVKDGRLSFVNRLDDVRGLSMCIHPNGKYLYLNNGNKIYICHIDEKSGALAESGCINVPSGTFSRCCCFDPSGKYFFVADVESDNVICFAADPESGKLDYVNVTGNIWGGASIAIVPKQEEE